MEIFIVMSGVKHENGLIYFVERDKNVAIERAKSLLSSKHPWAEKTSEIDSVYYIESGTAWVSVTRWPVPRADADMAPKIRNAYVEAAQRMHTDEGTIEVDDDAVVSTDKSLDDNGVYVAAWVWVDDADANVCTKCRAELTDDGEGYDGKCGACMDVEDPA